MQRLGQLAALLLLALTATQASEPLVACSFSIPGDWTRTLVGASARIHTLAGPNTDLHAYQPSPADVRNLLSADLIVGIDPSTEPWLKEIVDANKLTNKVLWLGSPWLSDLGQTVHTCKDPDHKGHVHEAHPEADPHLWMDPELVEKMVGTLAERLSRIQGIPREPIEQRRIAFTQAIREIDAAAAKLFKSIPKERRVIVTHHGNLGRFAGRYGIEVAGVILQSTSTEAADPSARGLARLVETVRNRGVRVVVCDRGQRAPAAFALARETGLRAPIELSIDSLDRPGMPADSWLGLMRENTRALAEAMDER